MNGLKPCKALILLAMMLAFSSSAVAATFHPQTIAESATDIPVLMAPPVQVGNYLFSRWGGGQGQHLIRVNAQDSTYQSFIGAGTGILDSSNLVVVNNRLYATSSGSISGSPSALRRSHFFYIPLDEDNTPQAPVLVYTCSNVASSASCTNIYRPTGAITTDASGNIYVGDHSNGSGSLGTGGVVWKIVPGADAATHTISIFQNFNGQTNNGHNATALLVVGDYLYGLNSAGGSNSKGTLFRKRLDGTGSLEVLHNFSDVVPDGELFARSTLLTDGDWIYGTLTDWANSSGHGALFRLKTDGSGFAVLHSFTGKDTAGTNHDGSKPAGPLVLKEGYIYGTTLKGGENDTGAIFRIKLDDASYEFSGSFEAVHTKPLGLIHDATSDSFYGTTRGEATDFRSGQMGGKQGSFFRLIEEKPFEVSLSASRNDVELGKENMVLNWSVQAAPADAVCSAISDPVNPDWDTPSLVLEDDNGKKKGSGTTADLAGVYSNMQANSDGSTKANNFTLTCTSASDSSITKTATVVVNARESLPLSVTFNATPDSIGEKTVFLWDITSQGNAGGECRGTSEPAGYWNSTYAFGVNSQQLDVPTANGRTGKHTYTFTLVCERNEKDLRNPESNSVTKTASLEFDFGPGNGVSSSSVSSANTSSAASTSSVSSTAVVSSSAGSSVASGPQGSGGGGGAMNLWWMLSLCLLALTRRVQL